MQQNETSAVERSLAVYRRLLRAYPPAFRERYGDEMARAFRDAARAAWRGAGFAGLVALWGRTLMDTVVSAARERVSGSSEEVTESLFAAIVRTIILPVLIGLVVIGDILAVWLLSKSFLPTIPAPNRGWAVLIAAINLGLFCGFPSRESGRVPWCKGTIRSAGLVGWLFLLMTAEQLSVIDVWGWPLIWVPIIFGGAERKWRHAAGSSDKELESITGWGLHLGVAIVALVLLLVVPAPYLASNVFLGFVVVVNAVAAMLPRIELMARNDATK